MSRRLLRDEVIEILELAKIGATVAEIANVTGRSAYAVYCKFREYDIAVKPSDRLDENIVTALKQNNGIRAIVDSRATPVQIADKYLSDSNNHTVSPKGIQYGSNKDTLEDIAIQLMEIADKLEVLSSSPVPYILGKPNVR